MTQAMENTGTELSSEEKLRRMRLEKGDLPNVKRYPLPLVDPERRRKKKA